MNSLAAGQTGCLMGGTYRQNISFSAGGSSDSARVTLTTAPGYSQATLNGVIYATPTANYVTLDNLRIDATNVSQGVALQLFGDHERLTNSDVYGANQDRIGIQIGYQREVAGVEIDHNRIHNFGVSGIYDHGIYVDRSNGALIHDNYIYDNQGGYGIQLWEHAQSSKIYNNTMDGNDAGSIIIAGAQNSTGSPSSNNDIYKNILSNPVSGQNTVIFWSGYSSGSPTGTGNAVHDNVYWKGTFDPGSAYGTKAGVTYTNNASADPQYVNRGGKDFTLAQGSPAVGYGANAQVAPASPPKNTTLPTVSGSAVVSQTLTASTGAWSVTPSSYSYAWQRCDSNGSACAAIAGATGSSYTVVSADAGSTLRVAVTATSSGGQATASSAPTAVVATPGGGGTPPSGGSTTSSLSEGAVLSGVVHWTATVPAGTKSVEFWADGQRLATQTAAPYAYDLDTSTYANAAHIVGIAWTDSSGVRHPASPATNVTIQNSASSSIGEGAVLSGVAHWTATVPAGTKSVEFWADGQRLTTQTAAPYAYDLNTSTYANGAHIVGVAWTDSAGVRHPASPATNVTIKN